MRRASSTLDMSWIGLLGWSRKRGSWKTPRLHLRACIPQELRRKWRHSASQRFQCITVGRKQDWDKIRDDSRASKEVRRSTVISYTFTGNTNHANHMDGSGKYDDLDKRFCLSLGVFRSAPHTCGFKAETPPEIRHILYRRRDLR